MPPRDPERDVIAADLADALAWAGQLGDAAELARRIVARHPGGELGARARTTLARLLWQEGGWEPLLSLADERLTHDDVQARERGVLLAASAFGRALVRSGELARAEHDARQALALGEQHGDDEVRVLALIALNMIFEMQGRLEEEMVVARRAVEIADASRHQAEVLRLHPHVWLGMTLGAAARFDDCLRVFA